MVVVWGVVFFVDVLYLLFVFNFCFLEDLVFFDRDLEECDLGVANLMFPRLKFRCQANSHTTSPAKPTHRLMKLETRDRSSRLYLVQNNSHTS